MRLGSFVMATNRPCVCYNVVRVRVCECVSHFARLDGKVKQNDEEIAAEAQSDGEWERKIKHVSFRFGLRFDLSENGRWPRFRAINSIATMQFNRFGTIASWSFFLCIACYHGL